jgi:DNA-binding SARP family transcriptional activator
VREILLERFERERPETRRREVHACVAGVLEAAGQGTDAVEHWLAAGDPDRAAVAVAAHGQALANTAPGTVAEWLKRLPVDARAMPELQLLEGRLTSGAGRLEEAVAPLRAALAGFEARAEPEAAWMARVALADTCAIQEDFEAVIPLADGFEASGSPVAPMVALSAGAALAGVGRYREATDLFARAAAHPAAGPLAPLVAGFRGFWVDLMCGRLDAALAGAREAVAMLERADLVNRLPYVIGFVAVIQDERGEQDAALATMARAQRISEQNGVGGYVGEVARRFRAGAGARAGRLDEAEAELAGAGELRRGWFAGDAEVTRATIAARRGAQAAACEAVRAALDAGALTLWRGRWRTTALLAPVLVDAGRPTWARELVEDALAARPPLASCARLLVLRGWLRSLEGDETGALADTLRAWEEAGDGPEHLVRRERPRLEPLLWTTLERGTLAPEAVIAALEAAEPGGGALLPFTRHPVPEVRRAAVLATATSGHPEAAGRVGELERDADPEVAAVARAARARVVAEPPSLVFTLMGGFSLRRGGFVVDAETWGRRAAQRLVRFMLVHRGAAVPEDELFEAFWPDRAATAARHSLQVELSSARSVLDPDGAERSVLAVADRTYRLELRQRDVVDSDEFERAASAALGATGAERLGLLQAAADRWGGEPLPEERFEGWATLWRERLIDLNSRVLGSLADACSAAGDQAGAVDAGRRQVELDPLDEAAQRRLMVAYARSGRRGHALRQYLACRRALVDGLGIEPAEETSALQRRVLAGEPL